MTPETNPETGIASLKEELNRLIAPFKEEGRKAAASLREKIRPSLLLLSNKTELAGNGGHSFFGSGAVAQANADFRVPVDREGKPMRFLAQLDLQALTNCGKEHGLSIDWLPEQGLLMFFVGQNRCRDTEGPTLKDRQSFNISLSLRQPEERKPGGSEPALTPIRFAFCQLLPQSPQPQDLPDQMAEPLSQALAAFAAKFNQFTIDSLAGEDLFLGAWQAEYLAASQDLKIMASFCASGIGFNHKRKNDWHYQHLVQEAPNYATAFYFKMPQMPETVVLIKPEDSRAKAFEKAWLFHI
ncbi:MAG: DUF1963 domain-containing protein [Candidatus Melainabacteria bacterium]|nr:DUF1963 domain-containing protein [Candidatus Melainabacteria bacterium]